MLVSIAILTSRVYISWRFTMLLLCHDRKEKQMSCKSLQTILNLKQIQFGDAKQYGNVCFYWKSNEGNTRDQTTVNFSPWEGV